MVLCFQVCFAVTPDDEAAVNYINSQKFDRFLGKGQNQHAVIILKRPGVSNIPPTAEMSKIEISDEFLDRFYSGSDESIKTDLRTNIEENVKAWRANIDGDDVIVAWAKPQTITRPDKKGRKKPVVVIHSETRLIELLQGETKAGKKAHLWTKNSPRENCADGSKAKSIVNLKKESEGMQLHLHHEDIYVALGLKPEAAVAEFMRSKQHLSGINSNFTWTVSADYQAENQKMNNVKNLDIQCKYMYLFFF